MTDRQFLTQFTKAVALMKENKDKKWVAAYISRAAPLAEKLGPAIGDTEAAEAAWHKEAGSKISVVDDAEKAYRHWADHVKADVHGAELGEFTHDHNSVAGLDEGLGKMIDAFEHHAGKGARKDDPVAAYAPDALKQLQPLQKKLDELVLDTRDTWQKFRDAAAAKNTIKVQAWEIFKSARRHLKADLGTAAAVAELKNPKRHQKGPASQPPALTKNSAGTT